MVFCTIVLSNGSTAALDLTDISFNGIPMTMSGFTSATWVKKFEMCFGMTFSCIVVVSGGHS